MTNHRNSRRVNGHAGPNGRPNGHGPASTERGGAPGNRGHAASDDASGLSVARATASPAAADLQPQASTGRDAYAEVAPPAPNGALYKAGSKRRAADKEPPPIPGGEFPLPSNPGEFAEEIHRNADLFIAWQRLLNSKDEKVRQRAVEKMTEMRYKGAAALADEPQQIIIDMPGPKRD